jgi:hypothetical protein
MEPLRNAVPFQQHQKWRTTINYSNYFATFVCYIMRIVNNPSSDPDLYQNNELKTASKHLRDELAKVLEQDGTKEALEDFKFEWRGPSSAEDLPIGDAGTRAITIASSLIPSFHQLALTLGQHPNELNIEVLRRPILRFCAWDSWNQQTNSFHQASALASRFAKLQWMIRAVFYYHYKETVADPGFNDNSFE